jgi:hypothetical protein
VANVLRMATVADIVTLIQAGSSDRRITALLSIDRGTNRCQASDQLLVEIAAFGQGPAADALEGFPPEGQAGMESACKIFQTTRISPCARPARALNFCGSERKRREILLICQPSLVSFFSSSASSQF